VQQQVDALNRAIDDRVPQFKQILKDANFRTVTVLLQDDVVRDIKGALYLLWGGVLFVLVIGCVNLANLMIVRSASRSREMATRNAIGGEMSRLARQLLTETTVLAAAGGLAGVLLAWWATRSVAALNLDQLPRGYEIQLDPIGLAFAAALILAVGLVLGVAPAFRLRYLNLNAALREETPRRHQWTPRTADAQSAGHRAGRHRPCAADWRRPAARQFPRGAEDGRGIHAVECDDGQRESAGRQLCTTGAAWRVRDPRLEQLRAIPGVESVGATTALPFSGALNNNLIMAEGHVMKPGESLLAPSQSLASAGYFETMKIPIVKGRSFRASDTAEATPVAIIDERLAERFWPGQDAVGRRLYRPSDPKDLQKITPQTQFFTVVGVAKEVVTANPSNDITPVGAFYFPIEQARPGGMTFTLRLAGPVNTIASDIKRVINGIDPELPVFRVQTMQEWIDRALVGRRAPMLIAAGFSLVALFLAGHRHLRRAGVRRG
jgi:hypothetical protein